MLCRGTEGTAMTTEVDVANNDVWAVKRNIYPHTPLPI